MNRLFLRLKFALSSYALTTDRSHRTYHEAVRGD
jgi:hypothetical protein